MTSELVFFVLFKMAGGFQKMFARLFWIKQVKVSKKAEQELFTCTKHGKTNTKKFLATSLEPSGRNLHNSCIR